jgi:hypothetical protein
MPPGMGAQLPQYETAAVRLKCALKWAKRNRHLISAVVWTLLAIPTVLWWKDSIMWVAIMSLYANFEASMSAHEAKKAKQQN